MLDYCYFIIIIIFIISIIFIIDIAFIITPLRLFSLFHYADDIITLFFRWFRFHYYCYY